MADSQQDLLADLVWPGEAYARATNLEFDRRDPEWVPDYKFTSKALRLLEEVLDSCQGSRRDRAWSVLGPYGSGKSTFSLFLLQLLTGSSSTWLQRCLVQLQLTSPAMEQRVQTEVLARGVRYFPVIVQGSRMPLDLALCRALHRAITDEMADTTWTSEHFRSSLHMALETMEASVSDTHTAVELYRRASELAKDGGYKGILVIIDEFGKFLERAAWQGDLPDLMAAQYLAELASAQQEPDMLFLLLLHQGFQQYASSFSQRQLAEWTKIQGRFRQVDFNEDPDNIYDLVAATLKESGRAQDFRSLIEHWMERVWGQVQNIPAFREHREDFWTTLLPRVYPFHPIALYALPRLSARLGQNERTLFGFLASDDPLGFKKFLRNTHLSGEELPSLTLDYLFEYFLTGARYASLPPDVQRRVSEIDAALDRLGDRPPLEVRLLKVLAAISVLRAGPSLPMSEEVIAAALDISSEEEHRKLSEALADLTARKIIVYRKYSSEYRIWQGSDFDFDDALSRVREDVEAGFNLSALLDQELAPRPLIAHRHSHETGTTRFFAVQFMAAQDALTADRGRLAETLEQTRADGLLLYLLPSNRRELGEVETWAQAQTDPHFLTVVPKEPVGVANLVHDLAALRRIRVAWPDLQDDPVAMKELSARIETADELLREAVDAITEPTTRGATWYWAGQMREVIDRLQMNRLLSTICDHLYPDSPRIRNELVNRRGLSSAVVVAVKKIIAGLIEGTGEPLLGFSGNGPEVSIFKAVFESQGLYCEDARGVFSLTGPTEKTDAGLRRVWEKIEEFLRSSVEAGKPVTHLYAVLVAPPFGVREGLLPLLTWAVLLYHRQRVCLYENETYVRDWSTEVFDRFVKAPGSFAVRWLILAGPVGRLVKELNCQLPAAEDLVVVNGAVSVAGFLENLYRWYHSLPDFAKHTHRLSSPALKLRKVITTAVDPIQMVLEGIPEALGVPVVTESSRLTRQYWAEYVDAFGTAILELASAYTVLRDELVGRLATTFGTRHMIPQLREFFRGLDKNVLQHVRDATAKAFLMRARDPQPNDVQWVESLGAALANQSPRFWMDHHREEFEDKLTLVALTLRDAERRAYARRTMPNMRRLILETVDSPVVDILLEDGEHSHISDTATKLLKFLEESTSNISQAQKQAILARALELTIVNSPQGGDGHEHR